MNNVIAISRKYTAIFESAEEGGYTVTVPALPGLVTEGDTFEEAKEMALDAIRCHLLSLLKRDVHIPEEKTVIERLTVTV
ncbi:MAG: type II toxin-antitoxin system HicB family antitoxin [Candidatus Electryoneaceae bacterium]|nr:type II toxin-antitoxin system HicB family antitoxin [Candidatus Electryoneaceae bacterium]